jgi:hypothetical protein
MHRPSRLVGAGCAFLLAISTIGPAVAMTRDRDAAPPVALVLANGFAAAGQRVTQGGAALATVRSADATVAVVARPGSSLSVASNAPKGNRPGTFTISMSTTRPKTARDATAYRDSGRTVIGDLVALGMPRADAEREFGGMATMDGDAAVVSRQLITFADAPLGADAEVARRASSTTAVTPYDAQCASINVTEGKITGYGCSTFYLVHQDGDDWWLTTKMKVSAHSSDDSWFSPKRLTQLGWRASWGAGNVLYDWDPYSTRPVGSCLTMTVKSSSPWADVSVQGTVCPDSLGPWTVTTARSGGIWNGMEHGTDYEGALATQAVHSPPGVALAYQSAWTLSYCDLWCN